MKLPKVQAAENPSGTETGTKGPWTSILNFTPVALTVVATVLAGLSSSEMTLAQYHRALAAQNQSKAGDQWGFFQAKRLRGMSIQSTIDLLTAQADSESVNETTLQRQSEEITAAVKRTTVAEQRLAGLLSKTASANPTLSHALQPQLDKLAAEIKTATERGAVIQDGMKETLKHDTVNQSLAFLTSDKLPTAATQKVEVKGLPEVITAVLARKSDGEIFPLVRALNAASIQDAIQAAELNIQAVEAANKPIADALAPLDRLVEQEVKLAGNLVRAVRPLQRTLDDLMAESIDQNRELVSALENLVRMVGNVQKEASTLNNDYRVARDNYLSRRYRAEGDRNQDAAIVYEIQVRKSSQMAEQHRERSTRFFYCMLAAQAGVTIATLSLAFRHRSLLWGLASAAGLTAVAVSVYVYLYM